MLRIRRGVVLSLALAIAFVMPPLSRDAGAGGAGPPDVGQLQGPTQVVVRELPTPSPSASVRGPAPALPIHRLPEQDVRAEPSQPLASAAINATDPSLAGQREVQPLAPPSISTQAFEGLDDDDNGSPYPTPPDPQLAVGDSHVFEIVNITGRIYDKGGGTVQSFSLASFFLVPGGWDNFDPKIIYDALSGRWFASYVSLEDNPGAATDFGRLHLAISQTGDPTGLWNVYFLEYTDWFPDYPGIGITDDKFTISANLFDIDGASIDASCTAGGYCGEQTIVIEKSDVMAGIAAGAAVFAPNLNRFTVRPTHSLSSVSDQWLATYDLFALDQLTLIRITGTPNAGNVTEALATNLTVAIQLDPPPSLTAGTEDCIVRGTNFGAPPCIDSGDFRVLEAIWRDGNLWASASAECNTSFSCAHLTEVDTGSVSVSQDIMFGAPGEYYSWPAIRTDASGDLYVSLTHTNTSIFAEARATGRQASDPLGAMSGSVLLRAGDVEHDSGRWGDYMGAAVDPVAPECVWLVGEYAKATAVQRWGTYIASMGYSGCELDADNDSYVDNVEAACGSDPLDASKAPERLGNGVDDDGDTFIDEVQAPVAGFDCDGDGFDDDEEDLYRYPAADGPAEAGADCNDNADDDGDGKRNDGCSPTVGTSHQKRCADTSPAGGDEADDQWPADFDDNGVVTILDISTFAFPAPSVWDNYPFPDGDGVTLPGDFWYNARWDLASPGLAINILDVTAINSPVPHLSGVRPGEVGLSLTCTPD